MKYVLDSSVALKWVLAEVDAVKALRLRDQSRAGIHDLIAPDIFPAELAHALARAERQRRISVADGWTHWRTAMVDCPALNTYLPLMPRAYAIASAARIGVYDCLYIALAEREGCDFITADARLVRNLQTSFSFIVALASLP
jgi:predicted nucleic acid-binding protein